MADLYLKKLESERKTLWATCRLKGLANDTPERLRIAEIDRAIAEHQAKKHGLMLPKRRHDPIFHNSPSGAPAKREVEL